LPGILLIKSAATNYFIAWKQHDCSITSILQVHNYLILCVYTTDNPWITNWLL
jgi:hypothetical protein